MGYKILLADDSVTVQKIITLTFSDEGVDVLTVNNGDEAIHRLQYMRPALVMADVSIPGKNGYEICEFVKTHPEMKDTPVVLLVPAFEPFDEERARRIGANQHLTKPFQSIRTLISTVKGLLESNPPKISTPLTNSSGLSNTGTLTQRAEAAAAQVISESTSSSPAKRSYPVQDTQPFPLDMEEEEEVIPAKAEVSVDNVLNLEDAFRQPAFGLAASSPLDLTFEEPVRATVFTPDEEPETEPEHEAPLPIAAVVTAEPVLAPAPTVQRNLTGDLDHVLDLDDVLPEVWPQTLSEAPPAEVPALTVESISQPVATAVIPQSVIDEIVNRVVAQLSEKLSGSLAQNLAAQLAPELAELVKKQTQVEPAAGPSPALLNEDSDSLLDLD